jgi:hypothetical protein
MMARVNPVLLRPAPGAVGRSAVSAGEITTAACVAHWCAGGALPSIPWIAGCVALMFALGLGVQRGAVRLRSAVLGAGAGQVVLHLCLQSGTAHGHDGLAWPMLVAHVVGAIATVLVWTLRQSAWDALLRLWRVRPLIVRAVRTQRRPVVGRSGVQVWIAVRHRGPPVGC